MASDFRKTIEKRAKEYASKMADISLSDIYNEALASIYEEGYIVGAIEQKAIDDAECVNQVLRGKISVINHDSEANYKQGYHDAVDKFCEMLKHNWQEYVYQDGDGIVHFGHWEADMRKAMEE